MNDKQRTVGVDGGVDILVNNAVIRQFHTIDAFLPEDRDHAVAVNLNAPFHLTPLALPGYSRAEMGPGSSTSRPCSGCADYVTTKTALIGTDRQRVLDLGQPWPSDVTLPQFDSDVVIPLSGTTLAPLHRSSE